MARGAPSRENLDRHGALIKKHNLPIAFGVDMFGPPSLLARQNLELTRRGRYFTPAEVLRQATSKTAKLVAMAGPRHPCRDGPLGVIESGACADILLVDGDPLEDLALLQDPAASLVVITKDGVIHKDTPEKECGQFQGKRRIIPPKHVNQQA